MTRRRMSEEKADEVSADGGSLEVMDLLMPGALLASFSVANNYPEMRGRSWKTMEVQAPTKKMPGPWGKCLQLRSRRGTVSSPLPHGRGAHHR